MHAPSLKTNANFRWLLGGAVVSNLGDQLTLVALPLLVLQLTGDPLALGLVIGLMGLPRAVFILLGGAVVDRLSPQRVRMASKLANACLLTVLALLVLNTRPVVTLELGSLLSIAVTMTPHLQAPLRSWPRAWRAAAPWVGCWPPTAPASCSAWRRPHWAARVCALPASAPPSCWSMRWPDC